MIIICSKCMYRSSTHLLQNVYRSCLSTVAIHFISDFHDPFVVPIVVHGALSVAFSRACIRVNPTCRSCRMASTCASVVPYTPSPSSPNDPYDAHSFGSFIVVDRCHWSEDSIPPWSEKPYLNPLPPNRLVVAAVLELRRDL